MHLTTLLGTWLAWVHLPSFTQDGWLRTLTLAGQHQNLVDQVGQSPLQTWVSAPLQATLSLAEGGHMHLLLGKVKSTKKVFPFSELWKVKVKVCQSNCGDCVSRGGKQSSAQMVKWWIFNITTVNWGHKKIWQRGKLCFIASVTESVATLMRI